MKTVRHILASSGVLLSAVALTSCVEPEVTTDASAPDAAADAAQQATLSERLERVPLAQFRGTVDLDNEEFSLELIDPRLEGLHRNLRGYIDWGRLRWNPEADA